MNAITIRINGVSEDLTATTVTDLLAQRGVAADGKGLAVAVNGHIVRRQSWAETPLAAGDDVEIVTVRQGG